MAALRSLRATASHEAWLALCYMALLVSVSTVPFSLKMRSNHVFNSTYSGIVLVGLVCAYFPKAHPRAEGHTKRAILAQLDYVGGALSIIGVTLL